MIKQWKDIKVGDKMKDGSIVTQVHRTHKEDCCKLTYDNDREMICAYRHIFLVNVSNLPIEGKQELEQNCTFVPLEESFEVNSDYILTPQEADIVESFCRNEPIKIKVDCIQDGEIEIYDFHFPLMTKRISLKQVIVKSEPQKVDENTYWLRRNIYLNMDENFNKGLIKVCKDKSVPRTYSTVKEVLYVS